MPRRRHVLGWVFSAVGFVLIAATTLTPLAGANEVGPAWWQAPSVSDVLRNLFLYVPLGFGLGRSGIRLRLSAVICGMLSVLIELAQISFVRGRNASLSDVISNTAGAAIGVWLAARWPTLVWSDSRSRSVLFYIWAWVLFAILLATSVGERPSFPAGNYRVRWAPQGFGADWFHGDLLAASIDNAVLRNSTLPLTNEPRAGWLARGVVLIARFVPGRPLTEESGIVGIADSQNREIIELAQERADLHFRVRTMATRVGLAAPTLVLDNELAPRAQSDTIGVLAGMSHGQLKLEVHRSKSQRSSTLNLSPSLGWLMISPWQDWTARAIESASVLWLIVLTFPLGYWGAGRIEYSGRRLCMAGMVLFVALVLVPSLADTHPGTWWDWLAAEGGAALGATASMFVRRAMNNRDRSELTTTRW